MESDKKSDTRIIVEEIANEESVNPSEEVKKETEPVEKKADNQPKKHMADSKSSINFNIFWIILPGIMLLGLLMGGIIAYSSGINKLKSNEGTKITKATPQPTIIADASPSAAPIPKVDLTKYKIKVLNGSGIKGEAGKVKDLLEKAGFTVESTGNTKTYDYTNTVIQTKEAVDKAFIDQLEKDLSKTYKMDKSVILKDTEASSVIVIVGSSKSN